MQSSLAVTSIGLPIHTSKQYACNIILTPDKNLDYPSLYNTYIYHLIMSCYTLLIIFIPWPWTSNLPNSLVIFSRKWASFKFTSGQYVSVDFNFSGTVSSFSTMGRMQRVRVVWNRCRAWSSSLQQNWLSVKCSENTNRIFLLRRMDVAICSLIGKPTVKSLKCQQTL